MALHTHTGQELKRRLSARKKKNAAKKKPAFKGAAEPFNGRKPGSSSSHNSGHGNGQQPLVGTTPRKKKPPVVSSHNTGQMKK